MGAISASNLPFLLANSTKYKLTLTKRRKINSYIQGEKAREQHFEEEELKTLHIAIICKKAHFGNLHHHFHLESCLLQLQCFQLKE